MPSLFYLLKGDDASLKLVSSNNLIKVVETIKKKFATKEEVNENKTSILLNNSQIKALSSEVSYNKNSISEIQNTVNNLNQEITGQRVKAIQLNNELIDIL